MRNSKFFSNLLLILLVFMIGFSCKSINIPSLGGGGVSESTDPKTAVTSAYKKFMDVKFYRAIVKTKNAQAEAVVEMDYNAPDRFWIKNTISGLKTEAIAIGNDSYIRLNEGKWTKSPSEEGGSIEKMRGKVTEEAFAAMKDFELVGKENVNGKDAIAYKFKSTYAGESSAKIWIDTNSGLPIKVDTEGTYAGNKVTMSTTYDYDRETKIETPKID